MAVFRQRYLLKWKKRTNEGENRKETAQPFLSDVTQKQHLLLLMSSVLQLLQLWAETGHSSGPELSSQTTHASLNRFSFSSLPLGFNVELSALNGFQDVNRRLEFHSRIPGPLFVFEPCPPDLYLLLLAISDTFMLLRVRWCSCIYFYKCLQVFV